MEIKYLHIKFIKIQVRWLQDSFYHNIHIFPILDTGKYRQFLIRNANTNFAVITDWRVVSISNTCLSLCNANDITHTKISTQPSLAKFEYVFPLIFCNAWTQVDLYFNLWFWNLFMLLRNMQISISCWNTLSATINKAILQALF